MAIGNIQYNKLLEENKKKMMYSYCQRYIWL